MIDTIFKDVKDKTKIAIQSSELPSGRPVEKKDVELLIERKKKMIEQESELDKIQLKKAGRPKKEDTEKKEGE